MDQQQVLHDARAAHGAYDVELLHLPHVKTNEAATMCGVNRKTIGRWIRSGKVRGFRLGRCRRVPVEDLEGLVERVQLQREPAKAQRGDRAREAETKRILKDHGVI